MLAAPLAQISRLSSQLLPLAAIRSSSFSRPSLLRGLGPGPARLWLLSWLLPGLVRRFPGSPVAGCSFPWLPASFAAARRRLLGARLLCFFLPPRPVQVPWPWPVMPSPPVSLFLHFARSSPRLRAAARGIGSPPLSSVFPAGSGSRLLLSCRCFSPGARACVIVRRSPSGLTLTGGGRSKTQTPAPPKKGVRHVPV